MRRTKTQEKSSGCLGFASNTCSWNLVRWHIVLERIVKNSRKRENGNSEP